MEEVTEENLQHEDLLIKLRAKLNEEKIKLWEPPFLQPDISISTDLQELARKYSTELTLSFDTVLQALQELQLHSLDRSKANTIYNETGEATFRIKATRPGQKPVLIKAQRKLDCMGCELFALVASQLSVAESSVKLIFNGKVIKPTSTLAEQGVKNGSQLMALVTKESPEEVRKEDQMYLEMKTTCDDAVLLADSVDDFGEDQYMKLEDQYGNAIEVPASERRALMVGLALHERGRSAAKNHNYPLALLLYLEADKTFSECRSSILKSVDNWAVLQLDISWCYLCLQTLSAAGDAADRLQRAEEGFKRSYGEDGQRLMALKGPKPAELVLIMRIYLLQGIVAYHQNRREDAQRLLQLAENQLNALRVEESSVQALMELGWSRAAARAGLRACSGDVDRAHQYLDERSEAKKQARETYDQERMRRQLGICQDGSLVKQDLVKALMTMGYSRPLAIVALRNTNNDVTEAVRLIQEQPDMLMGSDVSSEEWETTSSEDSLVQPNENLVEELVLMGYESGDAKIALKKTNNSLPDAVELLMERAGKVTDESSNPSTSTGGAKRRKSKRKQISKRRARKEALGRLTSAIQTEDDDHLDSSLVEEESFLAQYKSLL